MIQYTIFFEKSMHKDSHGKGGIFIDLQSRGLRYVYPFLSLFHIFKM